MAKTDRERKKAIKKRLLFIDRILDVLYDTPDLGNVSDPLEELIYLTITQRTRITTAMRVYRELKKEFPDMEDIINAPVSELRKVLSTGGRGNLRSRAIKEILGAIKEKTGKLSLEFLRGFSEEQALDFLFQLPWVGEKIARCALLYSLGHGVFPADSNVIRIFTRTGILDPLIGTLKSVEHRKAQTMIAEHIPPEIARTLHVNMVVHGQEVCKPGKPICGKCEIRKFCKYFREDTVRKHNENKFSVVDIFSGVGGISYGFIRRGYKVLLAVDNDSNAHESFLLNNPEMKEERVINSDITKLENGYIKELIGDERVDVLVAGIPCQGFSIVGYRTKPKLMEENGYTPEKDPRNKLYRQVLRFVDILKPEFVLVENVPGINSLKIKHRNKDRAIISLLETSLERKDYHCKILVLDAKDFGIPQKRKRIFCIARRNRALSDNIVEQMKDTAKEMGYDGNELKLRDAIENMLPLEAKEGKEVRKTENNKITDNNYYSKFIRTDGIILYNHVSRYHNVDDMKIIRKLKQRENYKNLLNRAPKVVEGRKRKTYKTTSFPDKFYRLSWNFPSRTIVSHLSKDGNSFIHPKQNRSLTVREAARIQSFPDDYIFTGSRFSQFIQVGNAVPPLLARIFAEYFKKLMYGDNHE